MRYIDFIGEQHRSTKRDYTSHVMANLDASCTKVAKKFGQEFFDGDRKYGYGGYQYDGRWKSIAEAMANHYQLSPRVSVLDVGCGKAHLLYEMMMHVPGLQVRGIDVSEYAISHAMPEVQPFLSVGAAQDLGSYRDKEFDLVISLNVLHNLYIYDLVKAIKEIERIGKKAYIVVESYRTEEERVNMLNWQLTCESFFKVEEWEWIYQKCGYTGDYSFIFFE